VTHSLSHLCSQYSVQRDATTPASEKHHSKEIMKYLSGACIFISEQRSCKRNK
jgi:hypothetical protein